MDREIPKEVRNKERNKKIIRYGAKLSTRPSIPAFWKCTEKVATAWM